MEGLAAFVRDVMERGRVPGLALAIVREGEVIFVEGFGLRDVGRGLPVTPDTVFPIASCTKPFTTLAVAMLVDEGALHWDAPVRAYLPGFALRDPVAADRLTLRDLATHRSGLPPHVFSWANPALTLDDMLPRLPHLEPSADFRAAYQYHNLMFALLGLVLGWVTGSGWDEVMRRRVFTPLRLARSWCSPDQVHDMDDVARPYLATADGVREVPYRRLGPIAPAGGIWASVQDVATWLAVHVGRGRRPGGQLISEPGLRELHRPQMVTTEPAFPPELSHVDACLGWNILTFRGETLLRHGGESDGVRGLVSFMPYRKLGVVCLANLHQTWLPYSVTYSVYERLLGLDPLPWHERFPPASGGPWPGQQEGARRDDADGPPPHILESYVGEFAHPGYGALSIRGEDGRLQAVLNGQPGALAPRQPDGFTLQFDGPTWTHTYRGEAGRNSAGAVARVAIPLEPSVTPIVFSRI